MVKINIAYPPFGSSQLIEVDDERKWRVFLDKRMSEEVPADSLGDEFAGYVFKITGGYDKQGFAMMQGVMLNHRARLLLDGRTGMYTPKRPGCRKRKSVRGCILSSDLSCINVIIVKRGPADLPKLTDAASERKNIRGPKRASNIRKAWGLAKKDDVREYVMKKTKSGKEGKKDRIKSPKIQRLITPVVRRRRAVVMKEKRKSQAKTKKEAADYANLLKQIRAQQRVSLLSKRREEKKSRVSTTTATKTTTEKKAAEKPKETKPATTTQKPATTQKPVETKKAEPSKRLKVVKQDKTKAGKK